MVEKNYTDLQTQIKHAEVDNVQQFERLEAAIHSTEANVARIVAALEKRPVDHSASNSVVITGSSPQGSHHRQPFQMRSIKA